MKTTISILAVLALAGWMQPAPALADATRSSFRLVSGENNLPAEEAEFIAMRLGVAFAEKLYNLVLESEIETLREHERATNPGSDEEIERLFASIQMELRWSLTRSGARKPWFLNVEVIELTDKKSLFRKSVKLASGRIKKGRLGQVAMNACPQIVDKVVDELENMPAPDRGRDGAISPLPDRTPLRINPKVDCGDDRLRGFEVLGRHYIEGFNRVEKVRDWPCQRAIEEAESYRLAHKRDIDDLLVKVRGQMRSIKPRKILFCRHKIQARTDKANLAYLVRCKSHHKQLTQTLGPLIYPEISILPSE